MAALLVGIGRQELRIYQSVANILRTASRKQQGVHPPNVPWRLISGQIECKQAIREVVAMGRRRSATAIMSTMSAHELRRRDCLVCCGGRHCMGSSNVSGLGTGGWVAHCGVDEAQARGSFGQRKGVWPPLYSLKGGHDQPTRASQGPPLLGGAQGPTLMQHTAQH